MVEEHCYERDVDHRVLRKQELLISSTLKPRMGQSANLSTSGGESETFGKQWFAGIRVTWSVESSTVLHLKRV